MRVTSFLLYEQIQQSLRKGMEDYSNFQTQVATGKRINKPSDDPIGIRKAMDYKLNISINNQYEANITSLKNSFDFTDNVFSSTLTLLANLKQITNDGATGSQTDEQRSISATQAAQIRDQILSLANSKFNGKYIFSGYRTDTNSFDPATYAYQGDTGLINVNIEQNMTITSNFVGSQTFGFALGKPGQPEIVQLTNGYSAQYTSVVGTNGTITTTVDIMDDQGNVVPDSSFSYDNVIQMANLAAMAFQDSDISKSTLRLQALSKPLADVANHILGVQTEGGVRVSAMDDQKAMIEACNLSLKNALSLTEDADLTATIMELKMADVALQALRESSKIVLSQSLMDFLK
jgi:flagellar hook-associated protein 3 FlgL